MKYLLAFNCWMLANLASCWDLSAIKMQENYFTSGIAIYRSRAFLVVPRSCCLNKLSYPTLVEVPWTGDVKSPFFPKKGKQFPNNREQLWHKCKYLQDAIDVQVETPKGRLWVLDKGNDFCQPKVLIYNLFFNNLLLIHELKNIPRSGLTSLTLDQNNNSNDVLAYVGDIGESSLVMFWLSKRTHKVVKLRSGNFNGFIGAKYMALSSKNSPKLYLSSADNSDALFSVDLHELRELRRFIAPTIAKVNLALEVNATFLGNKLGRSSAITTDLKNDLIYYMVRDYAIMRWDTSKSLTAEHHNVLAQSYENLPYVSRLFSGPFNGIWALVNPQRPEWCSDHNRTGSGSFPDFGDRMRVVQILKYNEIARP